MERARRKSEADDRGRDVRSDPVGKEEAQMLEEKNQPSLFRWRELHAETPKTRALHQADGVTIQVGERDPSRAEDNLQAAHPVSEEKPPVQHLYFTRSDH